MNIWERHQLNKSSPVGARLVCPSCGAVFCKQHPMQAFCRTKPKSVCRDAYRYQLFKNARDSQRRIEYAHCPVSASLPDSYFGDGIDYLCEGGDPD